MKIQRNHMSDKIIKLYLSFFYTGYFPKAPGTIGSAATIPFIYLLSQNISFYQLISLIIILTISSTFLTDYIQKKYHIHDPSWIVIDEVIGMLVTWCFIFPSTSIIDIILVFVFFRIFDIIKIYPASYFDKKVNHGFGTIFDDVLSGIYAGFFTFLVNYFL